MKKLTIKYRRFLFRKTLNIEVPEKYEELNERQFLAIIRLYKEYISVEEFYSQFFGLSAGLIARMDLYLLYKIASLAYFINTVEPVNYFLIKKIGSLIAPESRLKGMSFQQFMSADTFYSYYISTEAETYLNMFVASLFLKKNESYFPAGKQVEFDFSERCEEMEDVPEDVKYSVFMNWMLIKQWLGNSYPHLFPKSDVEKDAKGETIKPKPVTWLPVFDSFVGDNVADMDAYKKMDCMDAFRLLNTRIKNTKKTK